MLRDHCSAMETTSVLLVCMLALTCSVWTVHGRNFEVNIDDQDQEVDVEVSVKAGKLPGLCWACQWAIKKVKKAIGPNATAESISKKLLPICDKIGLLKSLCRKFVKSHLSVLIEELTTSDDVKTICVNTGACKSMELMHQLFFSSDDDSQIVMNEYP